MKRQSASRSGQPGQIKSEPLAIFPSSPSRDVGQGRKWPIRGEESGVIILEGGIGPEMEKTRPSTSFAKTDTSANSFKTGRKLIRKRDGRKKYTKEKKTATGRQRGTREDLRRHSNAFSTSHAGSVPAKAMRRGGKNGW